MRPFMKLAIHVSLFYLVFGITWILTSDYIVTAISPSVSEFLKYSVLKGIIFVLITTLLLFFVVKIVSERLWLIESQVSSILNDSEIPILLFSAKTLKITYANKAAMVFHESNREELEGKAINQLYEGNNLSSNEIATQSLKVLSAKKTLINNQTISVKLIHFGITVAKQDLVMELLIPENDLNTYRLLFNDLYNEMVLKADNLSELRFAHAHLYRRPLANIIALARLGSTENNIDELKQLNTLIIESANELDKYIEDTVNKYIIIPSSDLKPEKPEIT